MKLKNMFEKDINGTYNGRDLKLFNKIDDKNYYRAFSLF